MGGSGMKNRKILILFFMAISLYSCLLLNSCASFNILPEEDKAYSNEEEEAVNTLQHGSKYNKKSENMQTIKNAVISIMEDNYWPDATITNEELEKETKIAPDMYNDCLAEWQYTKTSVDMLIIIDAKEDYITEIELLLNKYRESQMTLYKDQLHNASKVFASRIEIIDNYICFVQLGADTSQISDTDKNAIILVCQEENEKAIDIIEKTILR